ncbi:MAG: addiction module protein [Spirochaetales bacterium]|nr:addiction module protein [Spirochaetales bacterium]
MLSSKVKETVKDLNPFDKALLIEYLYKTLNQHEDKENLNLWIKESESRLDGLKKGKLGSIDYSEIKATIL